MYSRSVLSLLVAAIVLSGLQQAAPGQNISPSDGAGADAGSAAPEAASPTENSPQPNPAPATPPPSMDQPPAAGNMGEDKSPEEQSGKSPEEEQLDASSPDKEESEKQPPSAEAPAKKRKPYDPVRQALFDLRSRQYERCLDRLDKVLESNPNNPQAHYIRAVDYVMMRQYARAAADYREVIRLVPNTDLGKRAEKGLKNLNF